MEREENFWKRFYFKGERRFSFTYCESFQTSFTCCGLLKNLILIILWCTRTLNKVNSCLGYFQPFLPSCAHCYLHLWQNSKLWRRSEAPLVLWLMPRGDTTHFQAWIMPKFKSPMFTDEKFCTRDQHYFTVFDAFNPGICLTKHLMHYHLFDYKVWGSKTSRIYANKI